MITYRSHYQRFAGNPIGCRCLVEKIQNPIRSDRIDAGKIPFVHSALPRWLNPKTLVNSFVE
jgi:hypothetical protein